MGRRSPRAGSCGPRTPGCRGRQRREGRARCRPAPTPAGPAGSPAVGRSARYRSGRRPRPTLIQHKHQNQTSLCLASYVAVNTILLAFAADRRAAVDIGRKAAAPAADAPCSNRLMSPARGAHGSKPGTDGQTDTVSLQRPCRILKVDKPQPRYTQRSKKILQYSSTVGV